MSRLVTEETGLLPNQRQPGSRRRRRGFVLAPRFTVYPEYALDPERWLAPAMRFAVLDRSDGEGLGRDEPGAVLPQYTDEVRNVGTGAEVILIGQRST